MGEHETIVPTDQPGRVYTFYSYKGGVGRSMALVNVGVLMALDGHKVLLVDWDLEAPGLEAFFLHAETCTVVGRPEETPGILDLLEARSSNDKVLSWRNCILKATFSATSLDIISAGRKTDSYYKRVHQLNWVALFNDYNIGNYLDSLREEWRRTYDFVLIDSRTGVTDIGDICTVLMPDAIVSMFVSSHQNMDGMKASIERARSARRKLPVNRNMLMVVPIHGRDESKTEYDISMHWKKIFEREFGFLYKEWLPKEIEPSEAVVKLYIPYVPIWSFGERIPVLENRTELQDPTSIGSAYLRLATLLSAQLDWYAVFEKADVQELRSAKIQLDTSLREYETLKSGMAVLDTIANRQASWSMTANKLKADIDRARWRVFFLSVLGAFLATLASQLGPPDDATPSAAADPRTWLAIAGALSLATATFFTQRLLGQEYITGWVRARAIAEALKGEAYKFATGAAPYDQPNAESLLNSERQKIEADGDDLIAMLVADPGAGSVPRAMLTPQQYVGRRVDEQIKFYNKRAGAYRATATWLRRTEFGLALAATLITAIASITGKSTHIFGVPFDIAALTAVLTTIAGAVLAHVEASRFDFLVTTYLATARQLEDRKGGAREPLSAFVNDCENIIATENMSWIARWAKPTRT
jgi:cellulose biosynthesis protein BcsQ